MKTLAAVAAGAFGATVVGAVLVVPMVISAGSMLGADPKKATGVNAALSCGDTGTVTKLVSSRTAKVPGFTDTQVRNAATIIGVGSDMKMPPRAWVIAVATAAQESGLHNMASSSTRYPVVARLSQSVPYERKGSDHDSVGLFQQRANEGDGGWGPTLELMKPKVAAGKFYAALRTVDGWQQMTLTRAAQKVQRSAYPNAYAKWEDEASRLVDALSGGAAKTSIDAPALGRCAAAETTQKVTSGGWIKPVNAPVGSPYGQRSGRLHAGVDLSTRRGRPVVAAAAGTVVHMECDKTELGYNCNRDGSPNTPGCGWYVDIKHSGNIITRYCHMLRRPLVDTGDQVKAGQQIGVVGTSGHSSGPHLHFEVHLRGDRSSGGTINPVKFMEQRGAPLGEKKSGAADT